MRKKLTILLSAAAVLSFLFVLASTARITQAFRNVKHDLYGRANLRANIIDTHLKMKDSHPFFSKTFTTGKDAGEFLNSRVPWVISGRLTPAKNSELSIDGVQKIDFSWMKRLHSYDYWELASFHSPLEKAMGAGEALDVAPFPDLQLARRWISLRLEQGFRKKQIREALKDSYKLTELIYSNEDFFSTAITLGLLKILNEAQEKAVAQHLISKKEWTPINYDLNRKARLAAWADLHWSHFMASNEFKNELYQHQPFFGSCAALNATAHGLSSWRSQSWVRNPLPMELNLKNYFKDYSIFAQQQKPYCRMKRLEYALHSPIKPYTPQATLEELSLQIPFLRQWTVAYYVSWAPDWLMAYEKNAPNN